MATFMQKDVLIEVISNVVGSVAYKVKTDNQDLLELPSFTRYTIRYEARSYKL